MEFASRGTTRLVLDSALEIRDDDGVFTLQFRIEGPKGVEVSIECCFKEGGTLEGAVPGFEAGDHFLKDGFATYTAGNDAIQIGPGIHEHGNIHMLDGEEYATHFGSIKAKGMHVYLTGVVPFSYRMTIR